MKTINNAANDIFNVADRYPANMADAMMDITITRPALHSHQ